MPGLREIHDALGIRPNWVAGGVEYPGQLGAVVDAMLAVAGGMANHVLCWRSIWEGTAQGAGRRRGYGVPGGPRATGQLGWQLPYGASAANLAALQIRSRMERFGLTREQLAPDRHRPARARQAQSEGDLLAILSTSTRISGRAWCPTRCACTTATSPATARRHSWSHGPSTLRLWTIPAVVVEALDCAHHDRFLWEGGQDIARLNSRWSTIWDRTDFTPVDVDYASLYDGFSVFVLCFLEDFGFCEFGESGEWVAEPARFSLGGQLPINTAGGQLSEVACTDSDTCTRPACRSVVTAELGKSPARNSPRAGWAEPTAERR